MCIKDKYVASTGLWFTYESNEMVALRKILLNWNACTLNCTDTSLFNVCQVMCLKRVYESLVKHGQQFHTECHSHAPFHVHFYHIYRREIQDLQGSNIVPPPKWCLRNVVHTHTHKILPWGLVSFCKARYREKQQNMLEILIYFIERIQISTECVLIFL